MLKKIVLIFLLLQACIPPTTTAQPAYETLKPRGTVIRPIKNEGRNEDGRYALVIGNASYKNSPLDNPVNDARDMATSLRRLGFDVIKKENLSRKEMANSIREFGELIAKGGVGLFYYAGHGMQVKGKNYLIPVNANIQHEDEVAYESIDVDRLLAKMHSAGNRLNIVILDACRNNPFARSFRSSAKGLARMNAPVGTLIAYATSPNRVASDGKRGERNGLYTKYLLENMEIPDLEIGQMFRRVRRAVRIASNKVQIPWESSSMEGDFYFVPQSRVVNPPSVVEPQPAVVERSGKNDPCDPLTDRSPAHCLFTD
jgi:uncharacterized caspase-like protein